MFADPLVASVEVISGSAVTNPFTLMNLGANSSQRVDVTAAAGDPKVLKISHTDVGKGTSARTRHLVRLEAYGVVEGVEDPTKVGSVYMVADIPKAGFSAAQKTALFYQFVGLVRGASGNVTYDGDPALFWDRFLNGEC